MRRRGQVRALLVAVSGVCSVLLALAIIVAAGGQLPDPIEPYGSLAGPAVGGLALMGIVLALWQQRLNDRESSSTVATMGEESRTQPAELPPAPILYGREADAASVNQAVAAGATVVVLTGPPGTGKSSLALHIAQHARARYPDGQLFAALRGASSDPVAPELVLARFLGALGRPAAEQRGTLEELAARFRSTVADRRLLVLLDDARDAAQVRPLLPGGVHCMAIVTSRTAIPDLPNAAVLTISGLEPDDALALLAATAGEERVAGDPDGARRVVAACAGLPLAVRLVGVRLRTRPRWTLTDLAARLDDESRRLDELRLGDRAVRSSFRASYDELSDLDQLVFRRAGSQPGPMFGLGAAAARCGLDEATVSDALDRLVDSFLIEMPTPDRYRVHDLLWLFATEMHEAHETPDERKSCLTGHIDWLCRDARPSEWLKDERDSILSVLRAAVDEGVGEPAWRLVETVHPLLTAPDESGYRLRLWKLGEAIALLLGDDLRRAQALRWISHSYGVSGQPGEELPAAEEALELARQVGDLAEAAKATRRVGEALRTRNRFTEAEAALRRALERFIDLGDVREEIEVRLELGTLYSTYHQPASSIPVLERALALLPAEEESLHGWVRLGLALAYKFADRWDESAALVEEAFVIAQRRHDDYLLGYCIHERGWFAVAEKRYADADRDFGEMLAIFEQIQHGVGVGTAYQALGISADAQGRYDDALAAFDAALHEFDRLGDQVRAGEVRLYRSSTLHTLGRLTEAATERQRAEAQVGDAPIYRGPDLLARLPQLHPQAPRN